MAFLRPQLNCTIVQPLWLVGTAMSPSLARPLESLCGSQLLNSCSLPGFADSHLSMLSWVFSQPLEGTPYADFWISFSYSSLLFSTLPHKFQLFQQPENLIPASSAQWAHCSLLGLYFFVLWSRNCLQEESQVMVGLIWAFLLLGITVLYYLLSQYLKKLSLYILSSFVIIYGRRASPVLVTLS